ncbi:MAG: hypothetical protein ABI240_08715 [Sphingomonas sp.]
MTTAHARFRARRSLIVALLVLAPLPAAAQTDSNVKQAGEVVSQPVRDVGIEKTKTPPLLIEVSHDPYGSAGTATCRQIAASIGDLTALIGPDYTIASKPKKRNIVKAGGQAVVNSLIPFRGLVREVSGAAPAERRYDAAVNAGFARRGFLRGLQQARKCRG